MTLKVAPCSRAAASYAVTRWHYSANMPRGRAACYGVWEDRDYIGAVVFGHSATPALGAPYGLVTGECIELQRIALRQHAHFVSEIVARSLALLGTANRGTRLVVSFADPDEGHHGGIYQAGNWIYTGVSSASAEYVVNGRRYQGRALANTRSTHPAGRGNYPNVLEWARVVMKDPSAHAVTGSSKYRYLYPLDKQMRRRVAKLAKPYPCGRSVDGDAPGFRLGEAGSTPADRSIVKAGA